MNSRIATLLMMIVIAAVAAAPLHAWNDQERISREEELYEDGTDYLDDGEWRRAAEKFRQVAELNLSNAPGALYWLAYAQHKMGQRSDALATLVDLQKRYQKSRWAADGKALEVEIRQSAGQNVAPDRVDDEELKLMAVNGLMHTNPERALPILEKIVTGPQLSPRIQERALFILAQSSAPRAMEILGRVARDGSRPDLQSKAIRNLGIVGGENSRRVLGEVYAASNDRRIKKSILNSYMIAGDRARLLALARSEPDTDLRGDAVKQLGLMGARNELVELYRSETSVGVKKSIIQAMFLHGNADTLGELARNERVPELRLAAIKNLGLIGGTRSSQHLLAIYETDTSPAVRRAVVNGLFLQNNAGALVGLARKEKDPALRKDIVSRLSLMNAPESQAYLLEILSQ